MQFTSITIIVAPYHVGIYDHRVGGGPLRILSHDIDRDLGKLAPVSYINIAPVDQFEGEIGRTFEILRRISNAVSTAAKNNSFPLVLSGNCYASVGTVAGLNQVNLIDSKHGVLWLDAHDDLDTPSTHENGYLDAMAASMLVGTSWHQLMKTIPGHQPVDVKQVIYCGLRDVSELQAQTIEKAEVDVIWGKTDKKVDFTTDLAAILDRRRSDIEDVHGFENIRLNTRVDRITNLDDGRVEMTAKSLHQSTTMTFDAVVLAIPPAAIHNIVDRPRWSFMKEQAIRGAHYEPLYKMGMHFRNRFWEQTDRFPCFGGQSTTDLRFRWIVFPSNEMGSSGSGVLLLYSWMSDAAKWSGLSQDERVKICLHDLSQYYADDPDIDVYDQYIESFDVLWTNEWCGGDAMYLPGQFSRFHEVAKEREGQIFFAGEHLSRHHTSIAGAIDSAWRTTGEVLGRGVPALGREYVSADQKRAGSKTDISSRPFKACVIPKHLNVQYVDMF